MNGWMELVTEICSVAGVSACQERPRWGAIEEYELALMSEKGCKLRNLGRDSFIHTYLLLKEVYNMVR